MPYATTRSPMRMHRATFFIFTLLLILAFITPAGAQEGSQLAPKEVGVMIQIDDFAKLRATWEKDPLVQKLLDRTGVMRGNEGWDLIQTAMGMDTGQILDAYFGKRVIFIAQEEGDGKPGFVLSQVARGDMDLAIEKLALIPQGQAGAFNLYTTSDDKGQFAFSDKWMAICDLAHLDYMTQTLERSATESNLAGDPTYQTLLKQMPHDRQALLYINQPAEQAVHVLALASEERKVTLHYAGQPNEKGRQLMQLNPRESLATGPFPASTLGVLAMNVLTPDMPLRNSRPMDRLIAPRTVRNDVLPKLAGPVVVALAQNNVSAAGTKGSRPEPVLALAIEMKDDAVAADFQRLLDGLVLILNLQSAQWDADPVTQSDHDYAGAAYRVADIGPTLAKRADRPELEKLQLVYGKVGSWYMLATNRSYYEACLDAAAQPDKRYQPTPLSAHAATTTNQVKISGVELGLLSLQAKPLADHLQQWISFWEQNRPQLLDAAQTQPLSPEGKFAQAVTVAHEVLAQLKNMELQLRKIDDSTMGATLMISR